MVLKFTVNNYVYGTLRAKNENRVIGTEESFLRKATR